MTLFKLQHSVNVCHLKRRVERYRFRLILEELVALLMGQQRLFIEAIFGSEGGCGVSVPLSIEVLTISLAVVKELFGVEESLPSALVSVECAVLVIASVGTALVSTEIAAFSAEFNISTFVVFFVVELFIPSVFVEMMRFLEAPQKMTLPVTLSIPLFSCVLPYSKNILLRLP